jgi:hypothetical protein
MIELCGELKQRSVINPNIVRTAMKEYILERILIEAPYGSKPHHGALEAFFDQCVPSPLRKDARILAETLISEMKQEISEGSHGTAMSKRFPRIAKILHMNINLSGIEKKIKPVIDKELEVLEEKTMVG